MKSKPSSRACVKGFSIVELLISVVIAAVLITVVLGLALSGKRLVEVDQGRTAVNQNLRSSLDIIGSDIQQAGENLSPGFPALELVDGGSGPDELLVRRQLNGATLTVTAIDPGELTVAGDVTAWTRHRQAAAGDARGYIYDPASQTGQFFTYTHEEDDGDPSTPQKLTINETLASNAGTFALLLEERRYRLVGDTLQVELTGGPLEVNDGRAQNLSFGITDVQFRLQVRNRADTVSATFDSFDQTNPDAAWSQAWNWADTHWVEVVIEGQAEAGRRTLDREVSARFFPRNVLSFN